jgi:hypothetical protein
MVGVKVQIRARVRAGSGPQAWVEGKHGRQADGVGAGSGPRALTMPDAPALALSPPLELGPGLGQSQGRGVGLRQERHLAARSGHQDRQDDAAHEQRWRARRGGVRLRSSRSLGDGKLGVGVSPPPPRHPYPYTPYLPPAPTPTTPSYP